MSVQAIAWVLEHSRSSGSTRCVLIAIANHIGPDGEGWVYRGRVMVEANCSLDSYLRAIRWAERHGELHREINQGEARQARADRKPNHFRLLLDATCPPRSSDGIGNLPTPGGADLHTPLPEQGRQVAHPEPLVTTEPSREPLLLAHGFDEFWRVYPRKVGKRTARKAWDNAIARASPAAIVAAAVGYAGRRAGQDPQYTPHPTTWLNRDSWLDEPDETIVLSNSTHAVQRWLQRTETDDPTGRREAHGNDGGRLFAPGD